MDDNGTALTLLVPAGQRLLAMLLDQQISRCATAVLYVVNDWIVGGQTFMLLVRLRAEANLFLM